MIKIDFNDFKSKEEFHHYIKEQCSFPEYYGYNLDALYDCLCEGQYSFLVTKQDYNDEQKAIIKVIEDAGCEIIINE